MYVHEVAEQFALLCLSFHCKKYPHQNSLHFGYPHLGYMFNYCNVLDLTT
jgi:hypothetical protein